MLVGLALVLTASMPAPGLAQTLPAVTSASAEMVEEAEDPLRGPIPWRASWGRSNVGNYLLMGGGVAVAAVNLVVGALGSGGDRGRNGFDEGVRDGLRLTNERARLFARNASDVTLTAMTSTPFLIDALLLAGWAHDSEDTAIQMIFVQIETVTTTLALQTLANVLLRRERPYGRTCGGPDPIGPDGGDDLPADTFLCRSPDRFYSFFSGHTSQTFASAAVTCTFHMQMPLLGDGPENTAVPCILGFATAAATGVLRVMGDQHYLSDVLTGAAVGTTVGFLLPWLLHFRDGAGGLDGAAADGEVQWALLPGPMGAQLVGWW